MKSDQPKPAIIAKNDEVKLAEGMAVIGADGQPVGTVKEVHETDFVVARTLQPAVTVPLKAVQGLTEQGIMLTVTGAQVDDHWWAHAGEDAGVDLSGPYD